MSIEPPPGISCWPVDPRDLTKLQAIIEGPLETPYEGGYFQLSINISDDYPFSPPKVVFETKIYHPNIDEEGRICMDTLKPKGWLPQMNIRSILLQLQVLMQEPNPDDPLVVDISNEYQYNLELFKDKARTQTEKYAKSEKVAPLQRMENVGSSGTATVPYKESHPKNNSSESETEEDTTESSDSSETSLDIKPVTIKSNKRKAINDIGKDIKKKKL
eukprot:TRINITY_DN7099_c0_g1_i2.p1 TRINITY_DN7099_c0_g1~~TRINITY_DN7099_c0_g1_i2.p1  ORF type:complete len:234 (-),score=68.59 TRINITY_DN7099_c0_g1_i2:28-678(-)